MVILGGLFVIGVIVLNCVVGGFLIREYVIGVFGFRLNVFFVFCGGVSRL